ncbi:hypothetical protein F3J20_27220 [Paraburkholderia sp. Cy-641]|uniref:hypothetical protein n=1 Tax=Paraburkholderia sp. Cy-641 TaxID=2608337 RepID=UPI001420AB7E|nr:hypothetical protein [Paraburkholderia sp. Cy-641]NIF81027.1 hypothetical protein [Paraburkholderia sp. Cy-641]
MSNVDEGNAILDRWHAAHKAAPDGKKDAAIKCSESSTCGRSGRPRSPVNLAVNAGLDCNQGKAPEERMPVVWRNEI